MSELHTPLIVDAVPGDVRFVVASPLTDGGAIAAAELGRTFKPKMLTNSSSSPRTGELTSHSSSFDEILTIFRKNSDENIENFAKI